MHPWLEAGRFLVPSLAAALGLAVLGGCARSQGQDGAWPPEEPREWRVEVERGTEREARERIEQRCGDVDGFVDTRDYGPGPDNVVYLGTTWRDYSDAVACVNGIPGLTLLTAPSVPSAS